MISKTEQRKPTSDQEIDTWMSETLDAQIHVQNLKLAKQLGLLEEKAVQEQEQKQTTKE